MIEIKNLNFSFPGSERQVLRDINLRVAEGAWISLLGPNGCGKSTLLHLITGVNRVCEGEITAAGRSRATTKRKAWAQTVALMPQKPTLPDGMSVREYIELGRFPHGKSNAALFNSTVAALNLGSFLDRDIQGLSGGEAQRVSLARALVQEPKVLLLDEPTSALDIGHAQEVLELVDTLRTSRGITVVAAMHDLNLAGLYGEEIALMRDGQIVAEGPAASVLSVERIREVYDAHVAVLQKQELVGSAPIVVPLRDKR